MKKIFAFTFILAFSSFLYAGEVNYFSGTWEETMAKAKAENKFVMLDCYTDWCYWCKVMDKSTFKSDSITKELDAKFISAHREMEKDKEGIALAAKFHVQAFPTFLFFSPDGKLIHTTVGYRQTADFYSELKKIEDGSGIESYPGYGTLIDPGFPDFYKKSFGTKDTRVIPKREVANDFLEKQKDLTSEVSWAILGRFTVNEKFSNSVLTNAAKLSELYGKEQVNQKIYFIIQSRVDSAAAHHDESELQKAFTDLDKYVEGDNSFTKISWRQYFYKKNGDWGKLTDFEQTIIDTSKIENISQAVNGLCWDYYEKCDDLKLCERTLPWMKKVIESKQEYASMDTYACLLYKTGHYGEAKVVAIKAIELGKDENEKTDSTEKLLIDIESKLK